MIAYLVLNCIFMACVLVALRRFLPQAQPSWWATLAVLLILTAVFDNIIISIGIVAYDTTKILGWYIYKAPVEDFFYALLAVYLVPALWRYFEKKGEEK